MVVKKIKMNEDFESEFSQIVGRNVNTEIIEECLTTIREAFKNYNPIKRFYFDSTTNTLHFKASISVDDCYIDVMYLNNLNGDKLVFYSRSDFNLSFTSRVFSKLQDSINFNITPESLENTFNRLKKTLRSLNLKDNLDLIDFMYYNY